jgi:copper chaperone NosL
VRPAGWRCRGGVAAQLVAPGDDPRFFDDIGCLASYLTEHAAQPAAVAYVVDHRTRRWVPAARALYSRIPDLDTPMGSHLAAYADESSRHDDEQTVRGSAVAVDVVFGTRVPPGGLP